MSDDLIERPKVSCLKRKHPVSTSSTDRKKFKNQPAHKMKKHPFAGRFGVKVRSSEAVPLLESIFAK